MIKIMEDFFFWMTFHKKLYKTKGKGSTWRAEKYPKGGGCVGGVS